MRSTRLIGDVTLEAVDHHRVADASSTHAVGKGWTKFTFKYIVRPNETIDGLRLRARGVEVELPRPHHVWTEESPDEVDVFFGSMPRGK